MCPIVAIAIGFLAVRWFAGTVEAIQWQREIDRQPHPIHPSSEELAAEAEAKRDGLRRWREAHPL